MGIISSVPEYVFFHWRPTVDIIAGVETTLPASCPPMRRLTHCIKVDVVGNTAAPLIIKHEAAAGAGEMRFDRSKYLTPGDAVTAARHSFFLVGVGFQTDKAYE